MNIRDARPGEIDAIASLIVDSYDQFAPPPDDPLADSWAEYRLDQANVAGRWPYSQHIVAERDGKLAGAVTFYPDASHPSLGEDRWPQGYASFRLLAVHPSARGLGLGRVLTEECLQRARSLGVEWMGLHTTRLMTVAREMYERMGFTRFPQQDIPISDDFVIVAYRLALR